jgi:hypothetical protein
MASATLNNGKAYGQWVGPYIRLIRISRAIIEHFKNTLIDATP